MLKHELKHELSDTLNEAEVSGALRYTLRKEPKDMGKNVRIDLLPVTTELRSN